MEDAAEEFHNQLHWLEMTNETLHFRPLQLAFFTLDTHLQTKREQKFLFASMQFTEIFMYISTVCSYIGSLALQCVYIMCMHVDHNTNTITGDFYFGTRATNLSSRSVFMECIPKLHHYYYCILCGWIKGTSRAV